MAKIVIKIAKCVYIFSSSHGVTYNELCEYGNPYNYGFDDDEENEDDNWWR